MMKNGKLIVVEGACDGIGKSTQVSKLKDRLLSDGENIISHHFPTYNTSNGALVEEYLNGNYGLPNELSPYFVNALYAVDRAIVWQKELKQEYEKGNIILLDRYTTSSLIYQASVIKDLQARRDFINYVVDFEYNKLGIKEPDNVIFLTAPFDLVSDLRNARKNNEGIQNDIHEANIEFMKGVYESANDVARMLSWDTVDCVKNGEFRSIEDIHEEIYTKVRKK